MRGPTTCSEDAARTDSVCRARISPFEEGNERFRRYPMRRMVNCEEIESFDISSAEQDAVLQGKVLVARGGGPTAVINRSLDT
jgi:hypothetical protein